MRKLIISILLAGAASSPVLAQDHGRWHHDEATSNNEQSREDRSQAREQRQEVREQVRAERSSGGGNAERMQQAQQRAAQQLEVRQQTQGQRRAWEQSRVQGSGNVAPQQVVQQQQGERYRGNRDRYPGGRRVEQSSRTDAWSRDRSNWSQTRDGDFRQRQSGEQQHYRDRNRWANGGWNRDWRNDRRYDWRGYRNNHRSTFHVGIYYDPFGYGYRPFDIGYSLAPLYYGQQYWIDPSLYSLPFPPPGTAWVRYWNDAVLVDLYSGQVVDVIHNFFW